jgi:quercetin dioxygenase-like cupin family protein
LKVSHWEAYVTGVPLVDVAEPVSVTSLQFLRLEPGFTSDFHPAPRRQFVFILAGTIELSVSDGAVRSFSPGNILLVEDTGGKGHKTRAVPSGECLYVTVATTNAQQLVL